MDQVAAIIGVLSGVLGIIAYFLPINTARARIFHAVYASVISIFVALSYHYASRQARIDSVSRAAEVLISEHQSKFTSRGFVYAALAFLEKNRDLYPDSYSRALLASQKFKFDEPGHDEDMIELSFTVKGILVGISALSTAQ